MVVTEIGKNLCCVVDAFSFFVLCSVKLWICWPMVRVHLESVEHQQSLLHCRPDRHTACPHQHCLIVSTANHPPEADRTAERQRSDDFCLFSITTGPVWLLWRNRAWGMTEPVLGIYNILILLQGPPFPLCLQSIRKLLRIDRWTVSYPTKEPVICRSNV